MKTRLALALLCTLSALPFAASAQVEDNRAVMERMDRLERDLMLVQRSNARGGSSGGTYSAGPMTGGAASSNVEVRLQQMEEQLRRFEGQIEEAKYQARQASDKTDKLQSDVEYRLNALEQRGAQGTAAPVAQPKISDPVATEQPAAAIEDEIDPVENTKPAAPVVKDAKQEYNDAFALLRQAKNDEANKAFTQFIAKHPKDPLVGNAYYWLGETYYVQRDYTKAADQFRLGYKANAAGPKAGDNLLKLAMSLSAQKKTKDACVVLNQVLTKFGATSATLKKKSEVEIERNKCAA